MQRDRTAPKILAILREGDQPTTAIAAKLGVTRDRAAVVLRELAREDLVERVDVVRSGRVGMPQNVWGLRW